MRAIISIALILTFLLHYSVKWLIIVHYEINKEYISEVYCQNKDKVNLHCDGKCYLLIELQKEEERQTQLVSFLKDNVELICERNFSSFNFIAPMNLHYYRLDRVLKLQKGFLSDIFWPPNP